MKRQDHCENELIDISWLINLSARKQNSQWKNRRYKIVQKKSAGRGTGQDSKPFIVTGRDGTIISPAGRRTGRDGKKISAGCETGRDASVFLTGWDGTENPRPADLWSRPRNTVLESYPAFQTPYFFSWDSSPPLFVCRAWISSRKKPKRLARAAPDSFNPRERKETSRNPQQIEWQNFRGRVYSMTILRQYLWPLLNERALHQNEQRRDKADKCSSTSRLINFLQWSDLTRGHRSGEFRQHFSAQTIGLSNGFTNTVFRDRLEDLSRCSQGHSMSHADVNSILHGSRDSVRQAEHLSTITNHLHILILVGSILDEELLDLLTGDAETRNATENTEVRSNVRATWMPHSIAIDENHLWRQMWKLFLFDIEKFHWRPVFLERPISWRCRESSFDNWHWSWPRCQRRIIDDHHWSHGLIVGLCVTDV